MKKNPNFVYYGVDGSVLSTSIEILGAKHCIKYLTLIADDGKKITKDGIELYDKKTVLADVVDEWYEVEA